MSEVANAIRPLWTPGINAVEGPLYSSLADWFRMQKYHVFEPLTSSTAFCIYVSDPESLLKAFAFDLDRLGCASFESLILSQKSAELPRSTSWLFIKSYYAAYFAAHSLMRLTKMSCTQVDQSAASAVAKVAKLYGADNGFTISAGTYRCAYDPNSRKLTCNQIASGGGSHEVVWDTFAKHIMAVSSEILKFGLTATTQPISIKLTELCAELLQNHSSAGWLSGLRNRVNYQQAFGCWFPYVSSLRHSEKLRGEQRMWLLDPMNIPLQEQGVWHDLVQAQRVCQFIVALCRVELADLATRSPSGKSFCDTGSAALLKQVAPLARRKAVE